MNKSILNTGVQSFVDENLNTDIMSVLLKKSPFPDVSSKELAQQIESKKKCLKKLPLWFTTAKIYYPKKLNIEQTSSELAAQYKTELINGKSIADLTGGFGIDSYYFSKKFNTVFHCEIDAELSEISKHNFKVLGSENILSILGDGLEFIKTNKTKFDWLYVDPSRRDDMKGKLFHLSDCKPDVTQNLDVLFSKSEQVLLKSAPLLDISSGIQSLLRIKEIHIVAIENEVKELLWVMNKNHLGAIHIKTVNIKSNETQKFNFELGEEKKSTSLIEQPQSYLYEPNAAILKSGAFKLVGKNFGLGKLHKHTHLYTSKNLILFPGRRFKIESAEPFSKKSMKKYHGIKANVTAKNFPINVAALRDRYKIKDGGGIYLFFTKTIKEELILIKCSKV